MITSLVRFYFGYFCADPVKKSCSFKSLMKFLLGRTFFRNISYIESSNFWKHIYISQQ